MIKLFVGGLAADIMEMDLAILISLHGTIDTVKVVRDKVTRKCKGYAFIEMKDQAQAENVVSMLNGETYKGNVLTVKISPENPAPAPVKYVKATDGFKKKRPRKQI